jgi:zinc protease
MFRDRSTSKRALTLEAKASSNGATDPDRTNYFMDLPAIALERRCSRIDRACLLDTISPERVDGRDVVKNERRQSYENRPYGMAWS